jgi:hypothetical protein
MAKVRVPLWQQPNKFAVLDTDAGRAVIGVNVFLPDGSLFNPAAVAPVVVAPAAPPAVGGVSVTVWGSIQDRPANIAAVEALTGVGVVTRAAGGALKPKALVAGPNVVITEGPDDITFEATVSEVATGSGGLWDLGDRITGMGRFDGGSRV